jgi:hypothetical protein
MICLAGATSLPLNSEEFCNSAGTDPDAGLPFHHRAPEGVPALSGPESRYGSRSTRQNSEESFAPYCRGRAAALSNRLRPRHWRRRARTLDENWLTSRRGSEEPVPGQDAFTSARSASSKKSPRLHSGTFGGLALETRASHPSWFPPSGPRAFKQVPRRFRTFAGDLTVA